MPGACLQLYLLPPTVPPASNCTSCLQLYLLPAIVPPASNRTPCTACAACTGPQLEPLLARCILPGICLAPGLPFAYQWAWDLLKGLPYQRRFLVYAGVWEVQREVPICRLACHKASEEVKKINRRSTATAADDK